MADNGLLSQREARLVRALLVSASVGEAARVASVSPRSASRYLARPEVRAELARCAAGTLAHVSSRLADAMAEALEVLREVQSDKAASTGARVSAARAILESGLRLSELVSLESRVALLEALEVARE